MANELYTVLVSNSMVVTRYHNHGQCLLRKNIGMACIFRVIGHYNHGAKLWHAGWLGDRG